MIGGTTAGLSPGAGGREGESLAAANVAESDTKPLTSRALSLTWSGLLLFDRHVGRLIVGGCSGGIAKYGGIKGDGGVIGEGEGGVIGGDLGGGLGGIDADAYTLS